MSSIDKITKYTTHISKAGRIYIAAECPGCKSPAFTYSIGFENKEFDQSYIDDSIIMLKQDAMDIGVSEDVEIDKETIIFFMKNNIKISKYFQLANTDSITDNMDDLTLQIPANKKFVLPRETHDARMGDKYRDD